MATKKKMLQAAAGQAGAGGAALDITDVFSTYLYEGNGGTQSINNGIALGDFGRGTSTLFGDGAFLNRTSDLTGNADGNTLTLSAWIFPEEDANQTFFEAANSSGSSRVRLALDDTQTLAFNLYDSSGIRLLNLESRATLGAGLPLKAWSHVLISVDLSDTSKRHLYINDAIPSHVDWSQYNNGTVDFTQPKWGVAGTPTSASDIERIAHLYFDYTYRDLSVASNRRHFIDVNGGSTSSSTQSALNPIIYLPLTEDYTTGKNLGTGGDFTVNGSPTVLNTGTEYEDGYGEGGLVWIKDRDSSGNHALFDTERGAGALLQSNVTLGEYSGGTDLSSFNSNGFTLGSTSFIALNTSGTNYASWTFRKAPKFFDVVTYTGNTVAGRTVSHNLGSVPGMIMVKRLNTSEGWFVYHRGMDATAPEDYYLQLNTAEARVDGTAWNDTAPTDTHFVLDADSAVNASGNTYVAYLFAHNDGDGEFGPDGDQDIIKCGSYTGNGSTNGPEIDLGFEPQWLLVKKSSDSENWYIYDSMRGVVTGPHDNGLDKKLYANAAISERGLNGSDPINFGASGFNIGTADNEINGSGGTYIYMAIRRGPLAQPESATEVFAADIASSSGTYTNDAGFPVDLAIIKARSSVDGHYTYDRMRGTPYLWTQSTQAETASGGAFDSNTQFRQTQAVGDFSDFIGWMFRRAPGFFDVVAYTASGNGTTISHNLGVEPELAIFKNRTSSGPDWVVHAPNLGTDGFLLLNTTNAVSTASNWYSATADQITFPTAYSGTATSGDNYISYLFSSLDGISKVGSYTGTGATLNIDCGFTSGARFVLIKCSSDGLSDWHVMDSTRGIVAGNDPFLYLNDTTAEDTGEDMIDPYSSGFALAANNRVNASGRTYIFYAIA